MGNERWIGFFDGMSSEHDEAELHDLYTQMIRVAYARLSNLTDAQDAVQEAWLRMLLKRDMLREQHKLFAWAKTITANVAINMKRRRLRITARSWDEDELVQLSDYRYTEDDSMLFLTDTLACLDERSRTILLYKFYYGYKDQEIADALAIPVGTVKARIHRSKTFLRQLMHTPNDAN